MKKITGIAFAFALLASSGSVWAQPHKGSGTITVSGMINTQLPEGNQGARADGMFNLGFGTFVTNHTQLFFGPTVTLSAGDSGGTGDSSVNASVGATVGIKQLFGGAASKTFPYVGLQASVFDFGSGGGGLPGEGSSILDKLMVGGSVGLKSYFKESVALDLSAQMFSPANDISAGLRNIRLAAALEYAF